MDAATETTNRSCWVGTEPKRTAWPPLTGPEIRADVAVVGGGIVGVTTALLLQRAGRSVVLLEAGRIATGGSTAKVTTQHGLTYASLIEDIGQEAGETYARSNEAAQRWIEQQVGELRIDCDLEPASAYTCAIGEAEAERVEREVEAAARYIATMRACFMRWIPAARISAAESGGIRPSATGTVTATALASPRTAPC